jgi:hypothetical protein
LDQAFEGAKGIDLARALMEVVLAKGRRKIGRAPKEGSAMAATAAPAVSVRCYRCVAHAHCAQECPIS